MYRALPLLFLLPLCAMAQKKPDLDALLEKRAFASGKARLPYRLLTPAAVEEKKTYPLVVFLHGAGERGGDNEAQLVHGVADFARASTRRKHPCFLIAPQCPAKKRWVEVDWTAASHAMPKEPSEPARLVLELVEKLCDELPIDRKRIYLTGLSMGGYATWDLLCRRPDLFAAGLPVCGGGDEAKADRLVNVPIWAFHGEKDPAVKVERSRGMIAAVKKAGGKPRYTEYAGVAHDSWTRTYRDAAVLDWLFA
jgi:predicted peptidase